MNTRQAKKVLSRWTPPDERMSARMVKASPIYRRALRRSDRVNIKWASKRPHHTTTRETKAQMRERVGIIAGGRQ